MSPIGEVSLLNVFFRLKRMGSILKFAKARKLGSSCSLFVLLLAGCDEQPPANKKFRKPLGATVADTILSQEPDYSNYSISDLQAKLEESGLVNIQEVEPSLLVDLRYSTTNNFLETDLYGELDQCYLQEDVAQKLQLAQLLLKSQYPSYSLFVFDGVRPRAVQWKMWKILDMPASEKTKYVSNPRNGSLHNFGAAVDLTIADEYGEPIDMGTPFDFFGELAYPRLEDKMLAEGKLSQKQLDNRLLLRSVMVDAGFTPLTTEWWHFNSCSRTVARQLYNIVE
ncbi:M15 family metallopeptidase [Flavobacteriales bacterium]|nr:M15 family metallopeptidase [Flavobacteriales bacterium]